MLNKKKVIYAFCIICVSIAIIYAISNRTYYYSLVFENKQGQDLEMSVQSNKGKSIPFFNIISVGLSTYTADFATPPNDLYKISWVVQDNNIYSAQADMRQAVSKRFKGYIYFTVDAENNLIYSASHEYRGASLFKQEAKGTKVENATN
ncbi:MAG: hypothetical protein ACOY3O_00225 [Thermodesulfobacteriota bacterium]